MTSPTSPFRHSGEEFTPAQWGRAWLVHLFTTLGIVAAMLALRDVLIGDVEHAKRAIIWLLLTLLIDGVDGPIARALEVERRVPLIDGFLLDLIIDYVACVIVPACFMYQFHVVPNNNYGVFVLCVLVFTSAIWFARKDMMTEDNFFRGFPAAWNLVGPMMYLLEAREGIGAAITLVLSVLCLTGMPFPHIARARYMRYYTWAGATCQIAGISIGTLTLPHHYQVVRVMIYAGTAYFVVLSGIRALHDRRERAVKQPPSAPVESPAEAR
jgi:phosphatidylcholine synthase